MGALISACALAFALYPVHAADPVELAAGSTMTCARRLDGAVFCWEPDAAPERVALPPTERIATGQNGVCALAASEVWCWPNPKTAPAKRALPPVHRLFEGCANTADGSWCWSRSAGPHRSPVGALSNAADGCLITTAGQVHCREPSRYEMTLEGRDAVDAAPKPLPAPAVATVGDGRRGCAQLGNGELWCWGHRSLRAKPMANPEMHPTLPPSRRPGRFAGQRLVFAPAGLCTVDASGAACPGPQNSLHALVDPMLLFDAKRLPLAVSRVRQLVAGSEHTCALDDAAKIWCWLPPPGPYPPEPTRSVALPAD